MEIWRTFERQRTSRALANEEIATKATGLVESSRENKKEII
jgi:hypothetical protein